MAEIFEEYEDQLENEEDFSTNWNDNIHESVMSGSDWTTETIISQIDKGNINLTPSFQRRSAWTDSRKSKFIESVILGLPIPQIVLAQSKTHRGKFIVLDGKQRLLALKCFAELREDSNFKKLKLKGLDVRKDLNGKYYSDILSDPNLEEDITNFENHTIRTIVIKNWFNEDFLYHVFLRLNTGSVQLSPQELRQALHPGDFTTFLTRYSENMSALREIFKNDEPDFRMRDVELLIRFLGFKYFIQKYNGVLKKFLDNVCKYFNDNWIVEQEKVKDDLIEFEKSHKFFVSIFGSSTYSKFTASGYENKFNRAIFDVFYFYLNNEENRNLVQSDKLKSAFENLCLTNMEFIRSIEQTTKSIGSTKTRLLAFGAMLNTEFNIEMDPRVMVL